MEQLPHSRVGELLPHIAQIMRNTGLPIDASDNDGTLFAPGLKYCPICSIPISSTYLRCIPCDAIAMQVPPLELPESVVTLAYAGATMQSQTDFYQYKDVANPSEPARWRLGILLYLFLELHASCISRHTRQAISAITIVPSGRGRVSHPLNDLLTMFPAEILRTPAIYVGPVRNARPEVLDPDYFHFDDDLRGRHLLVVEDSWVTGKSSVALAAQARRHGAAKVSVLSIGRYFNTGWPVNRLWLEKGVAKAPYDPYFCPVTRGECPPRH